MTAVYKKQFHSFFRPPVDWMDGWLDGQTDGMWMVVDCIHVWTGRQT